MNLIDKNYLANRSSLAAAVDREHRKNIGCYSNNDDESEDDEDRDPNLDPGFSSWADFNRYMYG